MRSFDAEVFGRFHSSLAPVSKVFTRSFWRKPTVSAFPDLAGAVPGGMPSCSRLRWLPYKRTPFSKTAEGGRIELPRVVPRRFSRPLDTPMSALPRRLSVPHGYAVSIGVPASLSKTRAFARTAVPPSVDLTAPVVAARNRESCSAAAEHPACYSLACSGAGFSSRNFFAAVRPNSNSFIARSSVRSNSVVRTPRVSMAMVRSKSDCSM